MPRIRTIKPEFWTDEKIVLLPFEARLLFIGLWNFADDLGHLPYRIGRLKMQIFPNDPVDLGDLILILDAFDLISILEMEDHDLVIKINNWVDHQRIDPGSISKMIQKPFSKKIIENSIKEAVFEKYGLSLSLLNCANINHSSEFFPTILQKCTTVGKNVLGKERKGKERKKTIDHSQANDPLFLDFWKLYPRKIAKTKCSKIYQKICESGKVTPEQILDGLKRYLPKYENTEIKYIPHPSTWLNQGRWEDEISEAELQPF